jgi:hypothetical protein
VVNCHYPPTNGGWVGVSFEENHQQQFPSFSLRLDNQSTSYMIIGCDRLLKPMISQTECLRLDKKLDIHEHVLQEFLQAWTTVLLERKYRFW